MRAPVLCRRSRRRQSSTTCGAATSPSTRSRSGSTANRRSSTRAAASTTCARAGSASCTTASFRDDATRIFRAFRYAARLGFAIEPHTHELIDEGIRVHRDRLGASGCGASWNCCSAMSRRATRSGGMCIGGRAGGDPRCAALDDASTAALRTVDCARFCGSPSRAVRLRVDGSRCDRRRRGCRSSSGCG